MLASLGDYVFEASVYNLSTFSDLKFTNSVQYTEHKLLGRKGVLEFTGLNASTCTLNIHLEYGLSEDLYGTVNYFYEAMNDGTALLFMIGPDVMGEGFWVIESMNESYPEISGQGDLVVCDLALTLKEYITDDEEED